MRRCYSSSRKELRRTGHSLGEYSVQRGHIPRVFEVVNVLQPECGIIAKAEEHAIKNGASPGSEVMLDLLW